MIANITQKLASLVVLPSIFGPMILPSICCRISTIITNLSADTGSIMSRITADGTAPINGPKKGMMLVSPTPGGSGFAEYVFKEFLCNYIPVGAVALALCWRLVSYYPYLLMGIVLLPRWVRGYLPKGGSKKEATSEGAKDIYNNKEGADEGPMA